MTATLYWKFAYDEYRFSHRYEISFIGVSTKKKHLHYSVCCVIFCFRRNKIQSLLEYLVNYGFFQTNTYHKQTNMNAYIKLQYMKNGKFLLPSYFLQMKLNFMINYIFNVNVKEEARENKMNKNRDIFLILVYSIFNHIILMLYIWKRERKRKKLEAIFLFMFCFIIIRGEVGWRKQFCWLMLFPYVHTHIIWLCYCGWIVCVCV